MSSYTEDMLVTGKEMKYWGGQLTEFAVWFDTLLAKYNSLVTLCHEWQPKCGGCEEFKEKLNEYEVIE